MPVLTNKTHTYHSRTIFSKILNITAKLLPFVEYLVHARHFPTLYVIPTATHLGPYLSTFIDYKTWTRLSWTTGGDVHTISILFSSSTNWKNLWWTYRWTLKISCRKKWDKVCGWHKQLNKCIEVRWNDGKFSACCDELDRCFL